jgi:hypothetical protein
MSFLNFLRSLFSGQKKSGGILLTFDKGTSPSVRLRLQSPDVVVVNHTLYRVVEATDAQLAVQPVTWNADGFEKPSPGARAIGIAWDDIRSLHIA